MGNSPSTNNYSNTSSSGSNKEEDKHFYDVIDYVATNYILTMNFQSLSKLSEKEYCDKLIVITSDIIQQHLSDAEITYLAQRVKNGVEVNEVKDEKVSFITKDNLESLDVSNDANKNLKKKRVCIGIAKFYVKIAHIFAAIIMTINPVYTYKNSTGESVKVNFMEKDTIPKGVDKKLYKLGICETRIDALKKGQTADPGNSESGNNDNVNKNNSSFKTVQPKVCDMNISDEGNLKTLADEPGIQELTQLYLDDNYDLSNGTFTGMSEETKKIFMNDLKLFYTAFTGNEQMPANIKKFSDIKLRDYNKNPGCKGEKPVLKQRYSTSGNDALFTEYAKNIQQMIRTASNNQARLLEVINDIFTFVIDPYSNKKIIRINPKLTEEMLQKCVEKTRRYIIELYIKCETDYVKGVKLYEAIVESKILYTTQRQIDTLKLEAKKIIDETREAAAPMQGPFVPKQALPNGQNTPLPIDNSLKSKENVMYSTEQKDDQINDEGINNKNVISPNQNQSPNIIISSEKNGETTSAANAL